MFLRNDMFFFLGCFLGLVQELNMVAGGLEQTLVGISYINNFISNIVAESGDLLTLLRPVGAGCNDIQFHSDLTFEENHIQE